MSGDVIATQEDWAYGLNKLIEDSHTGHEIYMRSSWSCMSSSVQLSEVELCSVLLERSRWCSHPASISPPSPPPLKWICGAWRDKKNGQMNGKRQGWGGQAEGQDGCLSTESIGSTGQKLQMCGCGRGFGVLVKCLGNKVLDFVCGCICSADYHSKYWS